MRKIIIPFDFTEVALNAVKYAIDFSTDKDELHVVHVHSGLLSIQSPLMLRAGQDYVDSLQEEIKNTIETNLNLSEVPGNLKTKAINGDPVHAIAKYCRRELIDIAIVGTRDKYDMVDRWVGTISLGIIKSLYIPVYLIPRNAEFKGFNKAIDFIDVYAASGGIIKTGLLDL